MSLVVMKFGGTSVEDATAITRTAGIVAGRVAAGKKPVVVDLHNTSLTGKHDRCYMSATGACDTKISGEHLISHSVLKVLADKQD